MVDLSEYSQTSIRMSSSSVRQADIPWIHFLALAQNLLETASQIKQVFALDWALET